MGMGASQARLLTITARVHDIEYAAQNIEDEKLQLATQRDDLYHAYCDALDAKKIQVAYSYDGTRTYVDATYATVCTYDPSRSQQYAIKDADSGKAIVSKEVYDMYKSYGFSSDKYSFAWAMLGIKDYDGKYDETYNSLAHEFQSLGVNKDETGGDFETLSGKAVSKLMTSVEKEVYDEIINDDPHGLESLYDAFVEADKGDNDLEKWQAYNEFRSTLYKNYGSKIYEKMRENSTSSPFAGDWDELCGEYNYYVHLFEEIQNCGGCISIDDFSKGHNTDNEWFNNAIGSGQVLIDMYENKNGWVETSVATSTNNNYLQQVADEADLKKAEAEYEYELGKINQKDAKYDKSLSKLETERTALTKESDSIKKVISDNTERTLGIFS